MTIVIDEAVLARVARERKFDPKTLEIARRLFLDGTAPKRLSAEYGVILQRIYAIRRAVRGAIEQHALQNGWFEIHLQGTAEAIEAAQLAFREKMNKP